MSTESAPASAGARGTRMKWVRRLYDWTLQWAERPGGTWALFVLAFAESSFFPVPPDVLLIALCMGAPMRFFHFAVVCSVGSVLGGMAGYAIGFYGYEVIGEPLVRLYHGEAIMERVKHWYDTYGFWGTLAAAVTPIPYKVFTIASGVFAFSFPQFLLASAVGRSLRFFAVAGLIRIFGPSVKAFIERYFDLLSIVFLVLLVGGFVAIRMLR